MTRTTISCVASLRKPRTALKAAAVLFVLCATGAALAGGDAPAQVNGDKIRQIAAPGNVGDWM